MSTELRTDDGYPLMTPGPSTRPRANLRCEPGSAITAPVSLDQSQDNSSGKRINDALPWAVLAALFGGLGFGGLVIMAIMMPQQMRAETRAAGAEIRAEFAQGVARAQALAELARKEASTAVDTVDNEVQRRRAREEIKR
jgi:hypothetical protein